MLTDLRAYMDADAETVAVGGETCFLNEDTPADIQCASMGGRADSDLELFNWSYLNSDYLNDVNNNWTGVCLDEIKRKLGYRFELVSGSFPDEAQPGQTVQLNLSVRNTGYAPPFNPRDIEYVLRHIGTGERYYASPNTNPRDWLAGSTQNLDQTFCLPADMPLGDYELLLHLPDPYDNLYGNSKYAIRMASKLPDNSDVWEDATGYNHLGHTLTVNLTAAGSNCNSQTTFSALSVLPVSWESFQAFVRSDKRVQLRWSTLEEYQNKGYEIERSLDGRQFDRIGWVPAMTDAPYKYEFLDSSPPASSVIYYRLRQVDWDGRSSYSTIASVYPKDREQNLTIYPNPSSAGFWVNSKLSGPVSLQLLHPDGQVAWHGQHHFDGEPLWVNPALAKGMYILVLTAGGEQVSERVLVH